MSGEPLREWRASQLLEQLGTPAAQPLLTALEKGDPEDLFTREAKASLQRLAGRPAAP